MKIRTDFVTNSSSSSYATVHVKSKMLADFFKKNKKYIKSENADRGTIRKISVKVKEDETDIKATVFHVSESPESMNGIVFNMLELVGLYDDWSDKIDSRIGGVDIDALDESIEEIVWTARRYGLDGDDGRYDRSSYQPEVLQSLLKKIATRNKCKPEEVTDDMFMQQVRPKPGVPTEEAKLQYTKESGKSSFYYTDTMIVKRKETDEGSRLIKRTKNASVKTTVRPDVSIKENNISCEEFRKYITKEETLLLKGKTVVVTSGAVLAAEKASIMDIRQKLSEAGAILRESVSGKTDLLICDPNDYSLTNKSLNAVKQIKAGKPLKIIAIENAIEALYNRTTTDD